MSVSGKKMQWYRRTCFTFDLNSKSKMKFILTTTSFETQKQIQNLRPLIKFSAQLTLCIALLASELQKNKIVKALVTVIFRI